MNMDIPMAIIRMLVFVLQAFIEDEYLPHVDNIIWNGQVNIQRLEHVRNILTERNQLHVLVIVEQTLAGDFTLLRRHYQRITRILQRFTVFCEERGRNYMSPYQWPRFCYRFILHHTNPVRQETSRTQNGNIVSMANGGDERPNLDQAGLNLLDGDINNEPQVEDIIDDPRLPIPDPVQVFPQEPQCQASPNLAQHAGSASDSQCLCGHYERNCRIQFECCEQFWPCHTCHNNQSSCGRRKLSARDTKQIKCAVCGEEQPLAQDCSRCGSRFAEYFCDLCKHLTGNNDNPYHCEKCGICRIHGDRSFHCDVCGVCLDVQLRGNHKCREGSAHDKCCICLEDAFTGCQILPCSHKVHKECATRMIRSGTTRCPICRERFPRKLERRSTTPRKLQ